MNDILGMISQAKTPQDEALALELIRSMLGAGAAPRPEGQQPFAFAQQAQPVQAQPVQAAPVVPVQQAVAPNPFDRIIANANSPQDQELAVEIIRSMLGKGAAPRKGEPYTFRKEQDNQPQKQAGVSDAALAAAAAVAAAPGSREAAVLDAKLLEVSSAGLPDPVSVSSDGIAKIKKADGSFLFTNVKDKTGRYTDAYMGEGDHSPLSTGVSGKIKDQLDSIRKASDSSTAAVLASNLNSSLASEYSRMENDAYTMATAKLGVKTVQDALLAQQTLDAEQRAYNPAMGESAKTTALRGQLASLEQQARSQAANWLDRNVSYRQLKAVEQDSKLAVELAVKRASAQEDRLQAKAYSDTLKKEAKKEEADQVVGSMRPEQRILAVRLNPELRIKGDEDPSSKNQELAKYVTREYRQNADFKQLWEAPPEEYPTMAFAGNNLARSLLIQDESAATGISEDELSNEFTAYNKMELSDADIKTYAERAIGPALSGKDRDTAIASFVSNYNQLRISTSASALKEKAKMDAMFKVARVREARQTRILSDVMSWAPQDSIISEAAKQAKAVTGKADLPSVLTQLVRDKPLQEKIVIYTQVREEMLRAASRYDNSSYGALNTAQLLNTFNSTAINLAQMTDVLRNAFAGIPMIGSSAVMGYDTLSKDVYRNLLN